MSGIYRSSVAKPFAEEKFSKKCLKLVNLSAKQKSIKRGVKEVAKGIKKGLKGVVFIAADTYPIDVFAHIPILCEKNDIPYVFVPSKKELGHAAATKKTSSCIMVILPAGSKDEDFSKTYKKIYKKATEACKTE
ncbi:putative multi-domain containing protein [Aduncisulcus paluster]|uniref:H/ACA ribonucleoprotein complex subunit 2 n=1 Tax=Aduncisulcus paluster TaxID=2918883 RepID=A0ABQ5JXJ8_9EUKA|nr:putative multi-domain containing protein [Aduncisulcus paluster]|eukprot:gnl/Carplike_NY0171/1714_a2316_936.p1 GENE.gnl/Carplike_NY0171/1714_a2316_936~~gnl/Carplike_NY0171/1714_a2316_936.p1  ORF type:complete len:144 (-),score=16.09 gnl/Carplike_NY0171/1714_a2316_936:87-488(-)